jgi:hypothetical protein
MTDKIEWKPYSPGPLPNGGAGFHAVSNKADINGHDEVDDEKLEQFTAEDRTWLENEAARHDKLIPTLGEK